MKKVSLVTVTYNAEENLAFFLPALQKNKTSLGSVFFVDNASQDRTGILLKDFQKESHTFFVHTFFNEKNLGYSAGINKGIQEALKRGGEYILVTNNDVLFEENSLEILLSDIEKTEALALGVPTHIGGGKIALGYTIPPHAYSEKEIFDLADTQEIAFPHGGTILFRRDFFKKIGFYDEGLFFGGDELDFLFRAEKYNKTAEEKVSFYSSVRSYKKVDHFTKHNTKNKFLKARKMLRGNARVYLKHKYSPTSAGLYKQQYKEIRTLAKNSFARMCVLIPLSFLGILQESFIFYKNRRK